MTDIERLTDIIKNSKNLVFFGGAGVSTESGIPDFRSNDGLYNQSFKNERPEEILSAEYFLKKTERFYEYYKSNMLCPNARPNDAHLALAELEKKGILNAVITQNIDALHTAAGSQKVLELHGSSARNYCMSCARLYDMEYIIKSNGVPRCDCGGVIKPDVVLYGEGLKTSVLYAAARAVENADTMIVGGTSLEVYPAASFVSEFHGENLIIINKTPTPFDRNACLLIREPIAQVFKQVMSAI